MAVMLTERFIVKFLFLCVFTASLAATAAEKSKKGVQAFILATTGDYSTETLASQLPFFIVRTNFIKNIWRQTLHSGFPSVLPQ